MNLPEQRIERRQQELFDSPQRGPNQSDHRVALFSFFSLRCSDPDRRPIIYNDGVHSIEVRPSQAGLATMDDKELLIYFGTLLAERLERGESPTQKIRCTVHDFCRMTGRTPGGSAYDRFEAALERLQGTQVRTNIEVRDLDSEGESDGETEYWTWLKKVKISYRRDRDGKRIMKAVEVEICDWLHRAILNDRQMLTFAPSYFNLSPTLRRVYEVANALCARYGGEDARGNAMPMEDLRQLLGVDDKDIRRLRTRLEKIAAGETPIPDFKVVFIPRPLAAGRKRRKSTEWLVGFEYQKGSSRRTDHARLDLGSSSAFDGLAQRAQPASTTDKGRARAA